MPFWRCYYHVIWATKNRAFSISTNVESVIFDGVHQKSRVLGVPIVGVNSCFDHLHVAAMIPPKIAVADWIQQVKGRTSHDVNEQFPDLDHPFRWQNSYGVLTFGAKQLDFVLTYIAHQKQHHAQNTLHPYLEKIEDEDR
jgi:putative transposase